MRVGLPAWRHGARKARHLENSVFGHEGVVQHDVFGAGAFHADDMPDIVDGEIFAREEVLGDFFFPLHAARDHAPLRMINARGKSPRAGQLKTTRNFFDGAGLLHRTCGDQHVRAIGPHLVLRLFGEAADVAGVTTDDGNDPRGGGAALGDRAADLEMSAPIELVAAVALGLVVLEQALFVEHGHCRFGHTAQRFGFIGAFAQHRHQSFGALH